MAQQETDIAIVGGGLGGLSTAARASQLGAKVLVLEQGSEELYPCNSRYAGGMIHLAFLDLSLSEAELVAKLKQLCPPDIDWSLVSEIAAQVGNTIQWLREIAGVKFVKGGELPFERWCLAPPRPLQTSLVWPGRGPDLLLRNLTKAMEQAGGKIQRGARVIDAARGQDGKFTITFEGSAGKGTVLAKAMVIADGGFQANPEYLGTFIARNQDALIQRNAGTGRGTGIELAKKLGIKLTRLDRFYGHLLSADADHNDKLWPYPIVDSVAVAGMLVDHTGARIADEGLGGIFLANALTQRDNPADAFAVADNNVWEGAGRIMRMPANPLIKSLGGRVFSAPSLAETAKAAGIDPQGLERTVSAFNDAIAKGEGARLTPPRSVHKSAAAILKTPPFHIIPLRPGITYTMGGLTVNNKAQAISEEGAVIAGLYATGATIGNTEGGESVFYLGGLTKAAVLGRIGAEDAAVYCKSA